MKTEAMLPQSVTLNVYDLLICFINCISKVLPTRTCYYRRKTDNTQVQLLSPQKLTTFKYNVNTLQHNLQVVHASWKVSAHIKENGHTACHGSISN